VLSSEITRSLIRSLHIMQAVTMRIESAYDGCDLDIGV